MTKNFISRDVRFLCSNCVAVEHLRRRPRLATRPLGYSLHEPARPSNCSLLRESGAEDARTPNATAWSADSAASAKRLECVRFIGAFRPARDGQQFMVPMRATSGVGALHEPRTVRRLLAGEPYCTCARAFAAGLV